MVIGLSGGIDSTLVRIWPSRRLAVTPSTGSSCRAWQPSDMMSDAEGVAEMLGIEYDVVEIQPSPRRSSTRSPTPRATSSPSAIYVFAAGGADYLVGNHEQTWSFRPETAVRHGRLLREIR